MKEEALALTLKIGKNPDSKDWQFQQIGATGNTPLSVGSDEFGGQSRRGIEALCLLTLLTYLSRIRAPEGPDHIPEKFTSSLKVLYSGNKKKPSAWQHRIFGGRPFPDKNESPESNGAFIRASVVNNKQLVRILKEVAVIVEVDIKSLDGEEISQSEISKICSQVIEPEDEKRISLRIPVREGKEINSTECSGKLDRSSRFSVIVEGSIHSAFCVIWIGSSEGVNSLYPWSIWSLIYREEEITKKDQPRRQKLEITSEKLLDIGSSKGVEACLVLEKSLRFKRSEIQAIESNLERLLSSMPEQLKDDQPRFTPIKIPARRFTTRRIKPVAEPAQWHKAIADALSGRAERAHLFEIPFL